MWANEGSQQWENLDEFQYAFSNENMPTFCIGMYACMHLISKYLL